MPVLPDRTSLGDLPSANSGRSHPNYEAVTAPGRQASEGYAALGEGQSQLGHGLQRAGLEVISYANRQQQEADQLANAQANAQTTIAHTDLLSDIDKNNDINALRGMKREDIQNKLFANAQKMYGDDTQKQQLYMAQHQGTVDNVLKYAQNRADKLYEDQARTGNLESIKQLGIRYAGAKTQEQRAEIAKTAGDVFDTAANNGLWTHEQAFKGKEDFLKGAQDDWILSLAPQERLKVLGAVAPGTVAAKDLPPVAAAFLTAVGGPESGNKYDVRYTPAGGTSFSGYSAHPSIAERIPNGPNAGKTSDAAGRYQFLGSTWRPIAAELGLKDFTPENQDRGAWHLAQKDYRKNTGRDLKSDLEKEGLTPKIMSSLGGTWEAWQSPDAQRRSAAAFNATMTGKHDTSAYYETANKNPDLAAISPARREQILNHSVAELSRVEHQTRADLAELKQYANADVQKIMDTGTPVEGHQNRLDQISQAYGPEAADQQQQNLYRASAVFQTKKAMETAPQDQLDGIAEQLKPSENSSDYPDQLPFYKAALKAKEQIITARNNDPGGYVDNLPSVSNQIQAYNPQQPTSFQNVVAARIQAQKTLGLPPTPISDAEVSHYVSRGFSADAIAEMRDKYGPYFDRAKTIVAKQAVKMGVNAPIASHIGSLELLGGDPVAISDLSNYQKMVMDPEAKQRMPTLSKGDIQTQVSSVYGGAFQAMPQFAATARNAAENLVVYRSVKGGQDPRSMDNDLAKVAFQQAAGARYVNDVQYGGVADHKPSSWYFQTQKVAAPPGMRADKVSQAINSITDADVAANPPMAGDGKTKIPMSVLSNAYLVSVAHGQYVVALGEPNSSDPQWVMDKVGNRFVLDLNELEPKLRERFPNIYLPASNQSASVE